MKAYFSGVMRKQAPLPHGSICVIYDDGWSADVPLTALQRLRIDEEAAAADSDAKWQLVFRETADHKHVEVCAVALGDWVEIPFKGR